MRSTQDRWIDLATLSGRLVIYGYPMTGRPGVPLPDGWESIPGACTPQSCAFRDHYQDLQTLNTQVFGLSTQSSIDQQEAAARLHLPFELLSDLDLSFTRALKLPTFEVEGKSLIKRVTLIVEDQIITKVFYPVFPPDQNADEVIEWLRHRAKLAAN